MNKEIRNKEIREEDLEKVNGGIEMPAILNPFGKDPDCPLPGSDDAHNTPGKG